MQFSTVIGQFVYCLYLIAYVFVCAMDFKLSYVAQKELTNHIDQMRLVNLFCPRSGTPSNFQYAVYDGAL